MREIGSFCVFVVLLVACSSRPLPGTTDETIGPPRLQAPPNGSVAGTLWFAPNLQPQFVWTAATGASAHQIQIGRTCEPVGAGCDLREPDIDTVVAETTFVPEQPLAVSM